MFVCNMSSICVFWLLYYRDKYKYFSSDNEPQLQYHIKKQYDLTTSSLRNFLKKTSYKQNYFLTCLQVNILRDTDFPNFKAKLKKQIAYHSLYLFEEFFNCGRFYTY